MWSPGFLHLGVRSARVLGWHRRFSLLSHESWGTRQAPGLCAVLHRGGTCWGRAFAVDPDQLDTVLKGLDRREIAYRRTDVWLEVEDGGDVSGRRAITYVADPSTPRLAADIGPGEQKTLVRQGVGTKGSSLSYLQKTVQCLDDDGHFRTDAHRLFAKVNANRGGNGKP